MKRWETAHQAENQCHQHQRNESKKNQRRCQASSSFIQASPKPSHAASCVVVPCGTLWNASLWDLGLQFLLNIQSDPKEHKLTDALRGRRYLFGTSFHISKGRKGFLKVFCSIMFHPVRSHVPRADHRNPRVRSEERTQWLQTAGPCVLRS